MHCAPAPALTDPACHLSAHVEEPHEWSYDRCSKDGPSDWEKDCKDNLQGSPVDICGAVAYPLPTISVSAWDVIRAASIKNNGHTVQVCGIGRLIPAPVLSMRIQNFSCSFCL